MTNATRTVGSIDVTALLDADLELDPITEAFADVPADALLADTEAAASVRTSVGDWRLRIRTWLIRHPQDLVLVDTGLGGPTSPTHEWVPEPGALLARLDDIGVSPADIPTVVITHVHDDHIGGLLDASGEPAFPNARHVLQRGPRVAAHARRRGRRGPSDLGTPRAARDARDARCDRRRSHVGDRHRAPPLARAHTRPSDRSHRVRRRPADDQRGHVEPPVAARAPGVAERPRQRSRRRG